MRSFALILLLLPLLSLASFSDHFENKTLRLDYYHTGDETHEYVSLDGWIEEPYWGGGLINLIDTFDFGKYKFHLLDFKTKELLYSRHFSTLFAEWRTTEEAKEYWKSFQETLIFPFPKNKIRIEFFSRDKENIWRLKYVLVLDPENHFIQKGPRVKRDKIKIHYSGTTAKHLDIVFLPEGYTEKQMDKFQKDCKRFASYILEAAPFKSLKDKINIWGILAPSVESGVDIPGEGVWKNTAMNCNFYTFDSERYLTTAHYHKVRDLSANAPCDQIFIIVNEKKYGGGGIYNFYSVCTSDHPASNFVAIHEFGHAFAGLADEYYTSEVSVIDFYPLSLEPWEPNITTLVDFERKWKDMLTTGTPVPTPTTSMYKGSLGVFEGAGYVAKGVYRPAYDCTMKSVRYDDFCPVCQRAIKQMVSFYQN